MGATNCPETPRQKMITMMYLVYTAMLALNVSAEVVEGFRSVGTAMTKSNENLQVKLEDTYTNFQLAYDNSPDKVREKWEQAQQVRAMSQKLGATIDSIEYSLIGKLTSEAKVNIDPDNPKVVRTIKFKNEDGTINLDSVKAAVDLGGFRWMEKGLDNTNDVTPFFLGSKAEGEYAQEGTNAYLLKQSVLEYEKSIKDILGEDSVHVKFGFNVDKKAFNKDKKLVSWEMLNFNEAVAGAALVTLVRMKAETMNAEFDAVNMLYKQISKGDHSFDQITLLSRPTRTYILQGGVYETDIFVGAYDSKQHFTATINGQQIPSGENGAAHYRTVCNTVGEHKVTGYAIVQGPDGDTRVEVQDVYTVGEPTASVMLDNMMVVYSGLDNPITISAPGIDSKNLRVTIEGNKAPIRPGDKPGKFIIKPTAGVKGLTINVDAMIDNKQTRVGKQDVKVKTIPKPLLRFNGELTGGRISKKDITAESVVVPIKDPDFQFAVDNRLIRIETMIVSIGSREFNVKGPKFNAEIASAAKNANKGDKLNILATVMMPDGVAQTVTYQATLK
jgi:gliding motility-associated protein GldM